jgi:uncharacterized glyoxalase superfamily protein PhnB
MAKRSLIEQLDRAVQATLAHPEASLPSADTELAPLVRLAAELRDLPRNDFKARLKADLQRRTPVTTTTVNPIREGFHTITPYLVVHEAPRLIDFVKQAFGAEELYRGGPGSQGGLHAEVRIGDSRMMIGGGGPGLPWRGTPLPTALHVYVKDADAVYQRALEAGAESVEKPIDQPYGDREAGVKDAFGNYWWIATRKEGGYIPPGMHTVTPFLHPLRAEPFINFLKRAFGAEEVERHASPDGVVHHAVVRIGNSALEMGEAHGSYQPMPSMFYVSVPDVDTAYRSALAAGGTSIAEPKDQPYGDRVAGVKDPFGNQWYMATHIKDVSP